MSEKNNWLRIYPSGYQPRQAIFRARHFKPGDTQEFPPDGTTVELEQTSDNLVKVKWITHRQDYDVVKTCWTDTRNLDV